MVRFDHIEQTKLDSLVRKVKALGGEVDERRSGRYQTQRKSYNS